MPSFVYSGVKTFFVYLGFKMFSIFINFFSNRLIKKMGVMSYEGVEAMLGKEMKG